ncbi:MAG: alanine racemase [Polyangiales bacterium]
MTDEPRTTPSLLPKAEIEDAVRPTRAEIDLGAIAANLRSVARYVATDVWAVVKADAYGHGAIEVARNVVRNGAKGLCVALIEEGLELRRVGITAPILVMSGVYRDGLDEAIDAGLTPVIYDRAQLEDLRRVGAQGRSVRVHLKVDTGMSRLGVTLSDLAKVAETIASMPHVTVEALMTHFANADCDDASYTDVQIARFDEALSVVRAAGIEPERRHACNSAGAFRFAQARYDMVRTGIALYGVAPFPHDGPALMPAFSLRTAVLALREVPAGTPVGYAGAYVCSKPTVLATIPIGYADGFFRRLSSEAEVLVKGGRARVVGNVSMDMASVDVTSIAKTVGVRVGDEVVLLGSQVGPAGAELIRAEEIAARVGTIPYEILCAVSRRVPRAYVDRDER